MTGETVSATVLANAASRTNDEAVAEAKAMIARAETIPMFDGKVELEGTITVAHGNEKIATTKNSSFEQVCDQFVTWIDAMESENS